MEIPSLNKLNQTPFLKPSSSQIDARQEQQDFSGISLYSDSETSKKAGLSFKGNLNLLNKKQFIPRFKQDLQNLYKTLEPLDNSLRKHIGVLLEQTKSPDYKKLSDEGKFICNRSVLINFILKEDKTPELLNTLLKTLNTNPRQERRIVNLINNQNWTKLLKNRMDTKKEFDLNNYDDMSLARNIAYKFRRTGDLKIAKIMAEVNGTYEKSFDSAISSIRKVKESAVKHGIWLHVSPIPKASELKIPSQMIGTGETQTQNTVLDLKQNIDLEKAGFKKGTNVNNFAIYAHAMSEDNFRPGLVKYITTEDEDSLLSVSYLTPKYCQTFANLKNGLLLDADPANIVASSNFNMNSGMGKGLKDFKALLHSDGKESRTEFARAFKEFGHYNDQEYSQSFKTLAHKSSLDEIKDPKLRMVVKKAIEKTITNEKSINELLVHAPIPRAVFSKCENPEDIPYSFRKYAEDNNMPIILFKDTKLSYS